MQSKKTLSFNHIEIANHLLMMKAAGIQKTQMSIQLEETLLSQVQQGLESHLDIDSDEEEEEEDEQLDYGKYKRQIEYQNPREVIGMLKYQKRQIEEIQKEHLVKIILSNKGIKIFSTHQANVYAAEIAFSQKITSKIRSHQIEKYGKQLYYSQKAKNKLNQIKILNYQHDKYCFYFHFDDIKEDIAQARILDVHNQYFREYVSFIGVYPKGNVLRKAFKRVAELKIRKLIEQKQDKYTEISEQGNGFILQQKDVYTLQSLRDDYMVQIKQQSLMFVVLIKDSQNIETKLTKLSKVKKYLQVSFNNLYELIDKDHLRLISMIININDLSLILKAKQFRKVFGNFMTQLYQINMENSYHIGLFFPNQREYRTQLGKKFEDRISKEFRIVTASYRMEGITLVIPKIADSQAGLMYLNVLDAAVDRKKELKRLKQIQNKIRQYKPSTSPQESIVTINQSEINNTTLIHDESIYNNVQNTTLNNTLLNNTLLRQINVPQITTIYSLNLNLDLPNYEKIENFFKRGPKDNQIQDVMQQQTGQLYKIWRIILKEGLPKHITNANKVTCMLKLSEYSPEDSQYFHKIRNGKAMEKGLLVELVVDFTVLDQRQDGFKVKQGRKAQYTPTHQVQLT